MARSCSRSLSLRCSLRARRLRLCVRGQPLALDHVVAEHDHGARHGADLVGRRGGGNSRRVSPSASRFITAARPLSGRVMLRPISQLKPRPIITVAMPTAMMPLRVRCLRCRQSVATPRWSRSLAEPMISSARGIMLLAVDVDDREQRIDLVGDLDPVARTSRCRASPVSSLLLHRRRCRRRWRKSR